MGIDIPEKLYKDIAKFCELNNFDIQVKIEEFIIQGFNIARYGISPFQKQIEPKVETKPKKEVKKTVKIEEKEVVENNQENNKIEETPKRTRKVKIIKS